VAQRRAEMAGLHAQEGAAHARIADLERKKAALRDERNRLLTDPATIERAARENYDFAAPRAVSEEVALPPRGASEGAAALPATPVDRLLGWGGYPWLLPVVVGLISALFLGLMSSVSTDPRAEAR